ncbi:DEAD/DEAH box helicase [Candidatus Woesearchaeota archaeon]|nr:DEAD/DEAH box helicase [Candidatus Woesearchaeota archaeon]
MFEIKGFTPRLYQQTILNSTMKNNTLVCLPTGRGKTKIALLAAVHRLNNFPKSKIIFLTPTKPLAAQIAEEFKVNSTIERVDVFTGETKPEERERIFKEADVIVSTPQGMSNDIINGKIDLRNVSMIVFDECHRAAGEYDYVWIAKQYQRLSLYPRIIGLSASPGSDLDKITEVCQNLFIEDIEVRNDNDPDLKPYVQETKVDYVEIELPKDFKEARDFLQKGLKQKLHLLKELNATDTVNIETKTQLLMAQKEIQKRLSTGERDLALWQSISIIAESMKLQYCIELLETQGIGATYEYMKKLNKEAETTKVKATKNLVIDENFKAAYYKVTNLFEAKEEHPKIGKLIEIVTKEIGRCEKILIFNNYRDSAAKLKLELDKIPGVKCELFVGQTKKNGTGLTQKKQIQLLEDYKAGKFNVIIGTSVGEEGIDIPAVDLIVFYEPVPSAIRTVQRRGRTGRQEKGRVLVLVTKGTRDEAYRWTAFHKEKRMHTILKDLKNKLMLTKPQEVTLSSFDSKIKIYADSREKASGVMKYLVENNIDVKMQNLDVGDFQLSDNVIVERKEVKDFVDSIIDKRLLDQVKDMKLNFEKPLIIIEGNDDIYSVRNIHANAIRGMLAWITIDMKIPVVHTRDSRDTAEMLITIAKREQGDSLGNFSIRGEKKPLSDKELKEFIIAGLPGVGTQLARNLLEEFRTVKNVVNASNEELQKVEKIGKKKAEDIRKILDEKY